MNATQRAWLYRVSAVILPLLVAYGLLTDDKAPLWLALVGALLAVPAPVTASRHVTPDDIEDEWEQE